MTYYKLIGSVLLAGSLLTNSVNAQEKRQDEIHIASLRSTHAEQINVDIQVNAQPLPLDLLCGGSYNEVHNKKDILLHIGVAKSLRQGKYRLVPYATLEGGVTRDSQQRREEGWMNQGNFSLATVLDYDFNDWIRLGIVAKHIKYTNNRISDEDVLGINLNIKHVHINLD